VVGAKARNPREGARQVGPGQHVSGKDGRLRILDTRTGAVVEDLGEIPAHEAGRSTRSAKRPQMPGIPDNAWVVDALWLNTGEPIAYFTTTWEVPPPPSSQDGQLLFLFNGLLDAGFEWILQPVLQWGSSDIGGGNYWAIANWYVPEPSLGVLPVTSALIEVQPGEVLQGVMTLTGQSGGQYSYSSSFVGYSSIDLAVNDVAELITASETLEVYGMTQCSDYPNTAFTAFYDIEIKTGQSASSATDATPSWQPVVNFTDCGENAVIISDDSPGGAVYLYYHQPAQALYFVNDKSSFGKDEVSDVISSHSQGLFPAAFYLALEGFTPQQLTIDQPSLIGPSVGGPFSKLQGVSVSPSAQYSPFYDTAAPHTAQRVLYPFDVKFDHTALADFPASGVTPEELTASITIGSAALGSKQQLKARTELTLVAGADPYFTNIDPAQDNAYYLSQDLRVFSIAPAGNNDTPVDNVPFQFVSGSPTVFDSTAAYNYIQALVKHFNNAYADPAQTDPFDLVHPKLPGQNAVYSGDSTVTPNAQKNGEVVNNYNFAVARVRLRGPSGVAGEAKGVRVFFRLFTTQTFDTNYINTAQGTSAGNPNVTYPSLPSGSPNAPTSPLPGTSAGGTVNGCSLPYFAAGDQSDLAAGGVNNRTIVIPAGEDQRWAYFGCFLDVYDQYYVIGGQDSQHWIAGSTHCCLVAQIAYDGVPIENTNGVIESPENCSQLAQRNLQITPSGKHGFPSSHLIPQTFDTHPSPPQAPTVPLGSYPDELMIDWRNTPLGSTASIYWPAVTVTEVIALAAEMYPSSALVATDAHTISCTVAPGMTYVPIPHTGSDSFAGLIAVQLPSSIHAGEEFKIVVRRITSRRLQERAIDTEAETIETPAAVAKGRMLAWRYVVGTFQMTIPVERNKTILPGEENQLAILKWRLQRLTPQDRWHPVLSRYIELLSDRVRGLGGDPNQIKPSPNGFFHAPAEGLLPASTGHEFTGKISGLRYDRFGDFDGFELVTLHAEEHRFRAHERRVEEIVREAWLQRTLVTILVGPEDPHWPAQIILRRA
jgi:hypothetical protein